MNRFLADRINASSVNMQEKQKLKISITGRWRMTGWLVAHEQVLVKRHPVAEGFQMHLFQCHVESGSVVSFQC